MKIAGARLSVAIPGVIAVLAGTAFSLACLLTGDDAFRFCSTDSVFDRLWGESRLAIGDRFYLESDRYFHKGVGHQRKRAFTDYFQQLKDEVQPRAHNHLSDAGILEIMPWLRLATQMDPHNVEAYTGAAFWIAMEGCDLKEAMNILAEARRKNPLNYRIALERGIILLKYGQFKEAAQAFDTGLRLWPRADRISDEQKLLDRAALLNYGGFLYELDGREINALAYYRESLKIKPDDQNLRDMIGEIQRGERRREDVERVLDVIRAKITQKQMEELCPHHEHE